MEGWMEGRETPLPGAQSWGPSLDGPLVLKTATSFAAHSLPLSFLLGSP